MIVCLKVGFFFTMWNILGGDSSLVVNETDTEVLKLIE